MIKSQIRIYQDHKEAGVVGDLIFFLNKIDFKNNNLYTINKMSSRKRKYSELEDSEKEPSEILKKNKN